MPRLVNGSHRNTRADLDHDLVLVAQLFGSNAPLRRRPSDLGVGLDCDWVDPHGLAPGLPKELAVGVVAVQQSKVGQPEAYGGLL